MAIRFFSGFETGLGVAEGSSVQGTPTFSTSPVISGARSLRCTPSGAGTGGITGACYAEGSPNPANANDADHYVVVRVRVVDAPDADDEPIYRFVNTSGAQKLEVRLNSSRQITVYNQAGTLVATGSTALSLDTNYDIWMRCGTSATVGAYAVLINGAAELSGTTDTTATNNGPFQIGKCNDRNGEGYDILFDDLVIDSAGYNRDAARTDRVVAVPITANGATAAWTAGTNGSDYAEADAEYPPDEATYLQSTATGDVHLFAVQDLATAGFAGATIKAVNLMARVIRAGAGNGTIQMRLVSGGTTTDTSDGNVAAASGGGSKVHIRETDPNTSAAWTESGFDAIQAGIEDTDAADRTRLTAYYVMVLLTPAAPLENDDSPESAGFGPPHRSPPKVIVYT